jgi:hypothetical protein
MRLSQNFWLSELTKSSTADRMGIANEPGIEQIVNLTVLTHHVLQPVREKFGVITVNSGYRSPQLNGKVGGSKTSQHCFGEAADFEQLGTPNGEVATWISKELDFDQLILEFYTKGKPNSGWVHCSFKKDGSNRRKIMTALRVKGKTKYEQGLIF